MMRGLTFLLLLGLTAAGAAPSYNDEIRPLLSANCFACHGPDEAERKAKTRLDITGGADLDEVLARISSNDPDEVMPPPESNKSLDPAEVKKLSEWIGAGAKYERHWAFVPPRRQALEDEVHAVDFLGKTGDAKPADPHTLIRRLHLDLVGLPPSVEEADAFAADPSPAAYAEIVDRLLASPEYGERWARRWLDLARYADTNGYEKDRDRSIWPFRDWVIRAITSDMPFDQFTIEQIAGDMLPDATPAQRVATGFHRNTMLNEEGGIDPLEFRFHAMTDRVATTGTTWLGLTTGCAQCHTHKYDPITHTDYFGMMAYLNNADEPDFRILGDDAAKQDERREEAKALEEALASHWPKSGDTPELDTAFSSWIEKERAENSGWAVIKPTALSANVPYLIDEGDGVVFVGGDTSKHDILTLKFPAHDQPIAALRLEALPDPRLPDGGPGTTFYEGRKGDFYLSEFEVKGRTIASATETFAKNRFGKNPVSARLASDGDIQTGWSVAERVNERHVAVFVLDKPLPTGEALELTLHFGRHFASTLGKFRLSASSRNDVTADLRDPQLATLLANDSPSAEQREQLMRLFLEQAPQLKKHTDRIAQLRKPSGGSMTMVLQERPGTHPRATYRHHRGEYTQPKEAVQPRLPDAIFPADQKPPGNRLEFARWLVSKDNPLTARVVANRQWAAFFGMGIVSTLDDFGMQGRLPSNQPLLDHLATYLVDQKWSMKALHRHIVTSAAYRAAEFPRQRLEAEIIRDSALAAAGVMSKKRFGPPVRPPQPGGVTEVAYGAPKWKPSEGADRFRRSIYTYQKRTAPFAMFTTFDGGSGEACIASRDRSNTPLQALTLMNDPMFIEIAGKFGQSIAALEGDADTKITAAFRRLLTRPPTDSELKALQAFHAKHDNWAALCRALLSLDESVTKP